VNAEYLSDLTKTCDNYNLSPSEYVFLHCLYAKKKLPRVVDDIHYKLRMIACGYLTMKYELTNKALEIFDDVQTHRDNIEKYRLMWPSMILPSGKNARCSYKELEMRFKWFLNNHDYSWDIIFKATEQYIQYYAERGYNFMRTSGFFIYKEATPKLRTSTLEEWCDKVLNSKDEHVSFDIDI
jgi:hypothetical protein